MEAKKITKKEFINLLASNKSVFLGSYHNFKEEHTNLISSACEKIIIEETDERRTVSSVKSNGLLFSNGSFLGLSGNGEKSYIKVGENIVCQITKIDYSNDFSCSCNDILYSFVMYYVCLN